MTVLGLDIGGANLKAAVPGGRAVAVPFPLWKQPERLAAALTELASAFPAADELAVTLTGELCDCYETKRAGVHAILDAVVRVAAGRPVRVWGTGGRFLSPEEARAVPLVVAAANWHALATFASRFAHEDGGLLIDIGSTTSDLVPLDHGLPVARGLTDVDRLARRELVYVGVRRTPVCAVAADPVCAEWFATTQDVYTVLGLLPEAPEDRDTADGRPATVEYSLARLARMLGGDRDQLDDATLVRFATRVDAHIREKLVAAARAVAGTAATTATAATAAATVTGTAPQEPTEPRTVIVSGSGEFLARRVAEEAFAGVPPRRVVSLSEELGPLVSACAPAHAVAVLAAESRP